MRMNMTRKDYRTLAYVLKRTNYGEADRILNLITPKGKVTAIAKGVRKEKSKLAGGVEIFSLVELNLHVGRSEFAVVTGSRMKKYYSNLLKDYGRMELAGAILKKTNRLAEHSDSSGYFRIVDQCLCELNDGLDDNLVRCWFILNTLKVSGEEVNLYRDVNGKKLSADVRYDWDIGQEAFSMNQNGLYGADEIKMLRLMSTADLKTAQKVKTLENLLAKITDFANMVSDG